MIGPLMAVVKKEFIQISRDIRTLIFLLFIPGFLLLLYGFALNFDVQHIPLAVCDQDRSVDSRELVGAFTNTEYFDLVARLDDPREVDSLMGRESFRIVLVIPRGFGNNLQAGRNASVQILLDGANAQSASTAAGYASAIIEGRSLKLTMESLSRAGAGKVALPLRMETRVWYNPELKSVNFLIPGLMAFLLAIIVVVSTAFSIVREKERGTMEQLRVSPLKPIELIVGKTVPYVFISLVSSHIILLLSRVLFGVTIKGDYGLLLLAMLVFLLGGLGQGLLISTVTRTQQVAFQIAILTTMLPTFILSGFVFPVRNMPVVIQAVTYLVPAKYFLIALRSVILKGVGGRAFWPQILFMLAFAALTLGLSIIRLRRPDEEDRTRRRKGKNIP